MAGLGRPHLCGWSNVACGGMDHTRISQGTSAPSLTLFICAAAAPSTCGHVPRPHLHAAGTYEEVAEGDFLEVVTKTDRVVAHFFHRDFERCRVMDKHLQVGPGCCSNELEVVPQRVKEWRLWCTTAGNAAGCAAPARHAASQPITRCGFLWRPCNNGCTAAVCRRWRRGTLARDSSKCPHR